MTFPPVKSNPYATRKMSRAVPHLWSAQRWKKMCIEALLDIRDLDRRLLIAETSTFRYKRESYVRREEVPLGLYYFYIRTGRLTLT